VIIGTCDDVEDDTMWVSNVEVLGRVRPNWYERTSGGLQASEGGGSIGDIERGDDGIMRAGRIAQEVQPEGTAGECDAVGRATHNRAAKDACIERLCGPRICHVECELVVAGERHCK